MDHYIAEFKKLKGNCSVRDYCVFLEQKTGLGFINPFQATEQMVLFLTDKGTYCVRVCGMGEFCSPQKPEHVGLRVVGKRIVCETLDKRYGFVRKWKRGENADYHSFVRAMHDSEQ